MSLIKRLYGNFYQEGLISAMTKAIKYFLKKLEIVLGILLGCVIPRNESLVVFANRSEKNEFSGNMKYLYLELSNEYDKNCMWITKYDRIKTILAENGYNVCKADSLEGKIWLLRSKYAITDVDFSSKQWGYLFSATTVQLWHGYPLKELPERNKSGLSKRIQVFDHACVNNHVEEAELRTHKRIREAHYTGYPRNDLFFRSIEDANIDVNSDIQERLGRIDSGETVIGYFPTWRENKDINPIKPEIFDSFLERHDAHCIIKPHRYTASFVSDSEFDRIHVHPPTGDIYPVLEEIDILITDYSSIYFDYLLLDQPVAFYAFDYEEYIENRGLNLDYECVTPGPKSYKFEGLLNNLSDIISEDTYRQERQEVRDQVFDDYKGKSVPNIYENILR